MTKRIILAVGLSVVAGFLLGWSVAWVAGGSADDKTAESFRTASADTIPPDLTAAAQNPGVDVDGSAIRALRQSALSPAGLEHMLRNVRSYRHLVEACRTMLTRLEDTDPRQLAATALALPPGFERDGMLFFVFGHFGETDPSAALQFLAALPPGPQRDEAMKWAALGALPVDADTAQAMADLMVDPRGKQELLADIVAVRAETDPEGAWRAALAITDPAVRQRAIEGCIAAWVRRDGGRALAHASSIVDPVLRADALAALARQKNVSSAALLDVVLERMPVGDAFQDAVADIFANWAPREPQAAAAALSKLPSGHAHTSATALAAEYLARLPGDKGEVAAWLRSLPPGEARTAGIESLFNVWGRTDPRGAVQALAGFAGREQDAAFHRLADGWSESDPQAALAWAAQLNPASSAWRDSAVRSATLQLAAVSPARAAESVARLPADLRAAAATALMINWSARDSESAARWLSAQPRGPQTDDAVRVLAHSLSQENPLAALDWAAGITRPEVRDSTVQSIALSWLQNDPEKARAWLQASALPENLKSGLLR